ncbi:MAG: GTP 3',8-cyclase MoaA [Spirochaetales bacterium]
MQLIDFYGRNHTYLRLSLTEACNLRCIYCRQDPGEVLEPFHHETSPCVALSLSTEEYLQIARLAPSLGIRKIRLTGGEPLLHPEIEKLVHEIQAISGIQDVSITTNGTLLKDRMPSLLRAGLKRVNISLDALEASTYAHITRRNLFHQAQQGLEAALHGGLHPVKLNVVLLKGINDGEVVEFLKFAKNEPVHVRFIECMPFTLAAKNWYLSLDRVPQLAKEAGFVLIPLSQHSSIDGPSEMYQIQGGRGQIGLIRPLSHRFCNRCNRLRVTSQGFLRPCLLNDVEVPLKDCLSNPVQASKRFAEALGYKEVMHALEKHRPHRTMLTIGG